MFDYLASAVENLLTAELGHQLRTEPAHDPFNTGWLSSFDPDQACPVRWGQVVDVIPFCNAYRVSTGARSFIWCSDSSMTGYGPYGARSLSTLPIGTYVFYVAHPESPYWGTIIAAEPVPAMHQRWQRSDWIWTGSRSGVRVDGAHRHTLSQPLAGLVAPWQAGRPIDQTAVGEWGAVTETGLAVFLDPFQAYVRVDEETGLFLFKWDDLARLSGHNLQVRSAVGETEDLDDDGEVSRLRGSVLYPWERLGVYLNKTTSTRTHTASEVQGTSPEYGMQEPATDDQQPFHRFTEFEGYLGQGFRRSLCLPPVSGATSRYPTQAVFPGVWEEFLSSAGGYAMRSAKHIILAKRPCIPVPKMIRRPEDAHVGTPHNPSGGLSLTAAMHLVCDEILVPTRTNDSIRAFLNNLVVSVTAAASGAAAIPLIDTVAAVAIADGFQHLGDALYRLSAILAAYPVEAKEHLIEVAAVIARLRDLNPPGGPSTKGFEPLIQATAILDMGAFAFNWTALHPYHYDPDVWYLPEEGDSLPVYTDMILPSYGTLMGALGLTFAQPPTPIKVPVDHRYGHARYYPNESLIAMLDDGGIVIGDGYGAEIRMTGGSMWLSCPGDLWLQPGRNVNAWAGRDMILRAQNSADLTAANSDVHIKAENNFVVICGNSGCGGALIESRATCPAYDYEGKIGEDTITTGVVLRAKDAQVVSWGRDVLLWADPRGSASSKGGVIIDSGNRVKVYCRYMDRFIQGSAMDFFVDGAGACSAANEYWPTKTNFGTDTTVGGKLAVSGCSWFGDNVAVSSGHIATEQAATYNNLVSTLSGANLTSAQTIVTSIGTRQTTLTSTIHTAEADATFRNGVYTKLVHAEGSLRTPVQYRTTNLILFESRWQHLARFSGQPANPWTEPTITHSTGLDNDTRPHPGDRVWGKDEPGVPPQRHFYNQDLSLYTFSGAGGNSIPRGANETEYETPAYQRPVSQVLKDSYTIIG